jgi:hypothetical protein
LNQLWIPGSSRCLMMRMGNACHVLQPYPNRNLSVQQRIYNYRLTRARRMIERAFCILANKWRIFHRPLDVTPQFCNTIVHNFVHLNNGFQLEDTLYESNFENILATRTRGNTKGKRVKTISPSILRHHTKLCLGSMIKYDLESVIPRRSIYMC